MDAESIPQLSAGQLSAISKIITAHRPIDLVESNASTNKAYLRAISRRGDTYGTWRIELKENSTLVQAIVGEKKYAEILPKEFPDVFERIMVGLEAWVKAVNAEELKELLSGNAQLQHLHPEHVMDPSKYYPIGGIAVW